MGTFNNNYYTQLKKYLSHFVPLINLVSISIVLISQDLHGFPRQDSIILNKTESTYLGDGSYDAGGEYGTIRNLTIEARATTVVLSWEPLVDSVKGTVRGYNVYRRTETGSYGPPVGYAGLDTVYMDSRLEMGTTYSYTITARFDSVEGGQSDEVTITTLLTQDNLYTYANLKTAVIIYKNTNAGTIPGDQIQGIKNGIDVARLFIWRNSKMKLNLQVKYYEIDEYKSFGGMYDYWDSIQKTAEHLRELGVMNTQYDIIFRISPATGGYWSYGVVNLDLPGPSRQTGFSHLVWPGISGVRYPGDDLDTHYDLSWVFLHEVQHSIDAIYDINGLPELHHGDRPHVFPYPVGEHYHFQATMFRVFDKYENLMSSWGGVYEAWDTGDYGFPDFESLLPMDEERFGSNPEMRDTDGDGLSDRDEFLNGIYNGSDPNNPDSNNNGILDGNDSYPRYRLNHFIPYYTTTIDGVVENEWTLAIDSVSYTQIGYSPKVYMGYDEDSLYIAIHLPEYCFYIDFRFDFEGDGWWYGRGNTEMRVSPHSKSILEMRSLDGSPEGREFARSIGEWEGGLWDDHPQYTAHFGRRVIEKDWINLRVNTNNSPEMQLEMAIPKNEYAGLYLDPGDKFGLNIYYHQVNEDPRQWATAFDLYSFVNFIFHEYDSTRFAGGSGTENDPYLVETPEHLNNVRDYYWAYFQQIADINLDISPWNRVKGWQPIGDENNKFTGLYDGNGFTISNLTINRPDTKWIGLFGYTDGSDLKNIIVYDANVMGESFVGGLVGKMKNSALSNSAAFGMVSGNWDIGGLVGETTEKSTINHSYANIHIICNNRNGGGLVGSHVWGSVINNSYAAGIITGGGSLGGLVGDHYNSSTNNSFATGDVSGGDILGGLVGNSASGSSITNSYATGSVQGISAIGGLVGWNRWSSAVMNSYAVGMVSGSDIIGGLVGGQDESSISSHSYWDISTTGLSLSAGGEGRTTGEMRFPYDMDTYISWNFNDTWAADINYNVNNGYPYLRWQQVATKPTYVLTLMAHPEHSGLVTGGGNYEEGDTVTVSATPTNGFVFIKWTVGDEEVMDGDSPAGLTFKYIMPASDILMIANFVGSPAGIPVLVSPENGAVHIAVDTILVWAEAEYAETYHIQLSIDPDFGNCVVDSGGVLTTSFDVRDLISLTTYHWRVCATGTGGMSNWSAVWSFTTIDVTSVARLGSDIPIEFVLNQNYPNPFNALTIIRYGLPKRGYVRLFVYNSLGQGVAQLVQEELEAGFYEVTFDASLLPSGVYICRLQAGEYLESKKILLLK